MAKKISSTEEADMMNSSSEEFNDYDVESEDFDSETDSSTDDPELEDSSCISAETSCSDTDIADKAEASLSETCVLHIEGKVAEDEVRSADAFVGGDAAWGPPQNYSPEIPLFTADPGIKVNTSNFELVDYFYVFVTEAILQDMVCYTNLYAEQYLSSHPLPEYAQAQEWHPTNIHEIKRFLALTIAMGLHTGNTLASYWDTTTVISIPLFSAIMPMNRYQVLLRFLHFNDNATATPPNEPGHDQLHKLRPLIESLCKRFAEVYTPSQNLCVDESHMFFKGLRFQQNSPRKRSCNGIKFYKLCESKTGYTSNFMIYEGADSSLDPPGCPLDFTVGDKIVWELLIPLLGRGYHIYVDNFYTSIPLFRALHSLDTPACGIVSHMRKGLPKTLLNKSLRPGETYGLRSSELLAIKHCDTKTEYMLTTIHDESVIVEQRAGNRPPKSKPLCSKEYNKHIGGVNKTEQIQEYDATRKTKSWYKKAAFYMIQVALYNSYVVYKAAVPGLKLSFYKYQLQLLPALLFGDVEEVPDVPDNDNVARMVGKHFIDNIPPTLNKKYAQRACKVCRKKGVRRDVRYYCPKCPSKPALCFQPCFELYHTVVHYQNL
ncbi:piggyBac transposable element-derived protein 4-like [Xenopus laevis]|uniref:PiggyBac transposable element-derived protein 4-like n=1 Tax=Xenopus laevis TaxID=8355 RepID=A0A8J0TAJ1_XENLA|nr:piggyBac transposable element-derived protein 4-like [Xenopus laevis]XP_018081223.1 piggyBac transposable element-derived protein 4-like [Xenopus laevis]